jgi:2-phosphoglycerate kinase
MSGERGAHGLDHVIWLGGSACSGKTTVARRLAAVHGLALYSCDEHFEAHRLRASPELHPHFHRLMDQSPEELWARPGRELARDLLRFYQDEFTMVVEDLRAIPGPVIAEGVGLLPARVTELAGRGRAAWLIATPEFRRERYPQRGPLMAELLGRCSDPQRALANWMARDDQIATELAAEAAALGLPVVVVEEGSTVEATAARVAMALGLA